MDAQERRRLVGAAAVAALAAFALAAGSAASRTAPAQVKLRRTSLGMVLVSGTGRTLYLFTKDKLHRSTCAGACAVNWPPYLTVGRPTAGAGVKAALLGTIRRPGGKLQVAYAGHPLYFFKFDTGPGSTKGENVDAFGGEWYAVSAQGTKVEPKAASSGGYGGGRYGGGGTTTTTTTTGSGYGGGYG